MRKCILSITLSLVILMSLINIKVYADEEEQVTDYSVNLIYNNHNIPKEGYQTIDNYNSYYDMLSGNLKNDIIFIGYTETQYNRDQFEAFYNSINYIGNNEFLDFSELTFKAITYDNNVIPFNECKYFISLDADTSNMYITFYLMYSPTQSPIYISGQQIGSDNMFYVSSHRYYMFKNLIDDKYYASYSEFNIGGVVAALDTDVSVAPAPNGILTFYHYYNFGNIILSSDPVYYEWNGQNDTVNNDLYNMGYTSPYYIYWHLKEGDDTTGFLTDRRIFTDGSNDPEIIGDEVDYDLFEGNMGFKYFKSTCALNYNNHTQDYYPYLYLDYLPNNYTNIHINAATVYYEIKVSLNMHWQYNNDYNSDYLQTIGFSSKGNYLLSEHLNNYSFFFTKNSSLNVEKSGRDLPRGIHPTGHISNDEINSINDLINYGMEILEHKYPTYSDGSLGLYMSLYVVDGVTNNTSKLYELKYNLWKNTYTDNIDVFVDDDDKKFDDFKRSYDYIYDDDEQYPIKYGDYVPTNIIDSGQYFGDDSASASIGDITIGSTVAELIVDMSEEEWLQHSPTFNNMMQAVKQGYIDTAEDSGSVLDLMRKTYDIFPPEVWKYLLTAIGVISSLAIIRYIRRG